MRMPGFTAEASLREAATGYRAKVVSSYGAAVVPANVCWVCTPWGCEWKPCFIRASWPA
jgi:hypothetical protein